MWTGWSDACAPDSPSTFTEIVDWGDETPPELFSNATQGCIDPSCPSVDTSYSLLLQHAYTAAGTYFALVHVNDMNHGGTCAIRTQVVVDP